MDKNKRNLVILLVAVVLCVVLIAGLLLLGQEKEAKNLIAQAGDTEVTTAQIDEYLDKGVPSEYRKKYERDYIAQGISVFLRKEGYKRLLKEEGLSVTQEDVAETKESLRDQACGKDAACPREIEYAWALNSELIAYDDALQQKYKGIGYEPTDNEIRKWYKDHQHLQQLGPLTDARVREQVIVDLTAFGAYKVNELRQEMNMQVIETADFESQYKWVQDMLLANDGIPPAAGGYQEKSE
jgi:hypothetical protein